MSKKKTEAVEVVRAIKGFDANWQCRGYQFKVGETYAHEGSVKACESGFHSIEGNPLEVFSYYEPGTSLYAEVEASGQIARHDDDSKIASANLRIVAQISVIDVVSRAVRWILDRLDKDAAAQQVMTGDSSAATNTGYRSAATNTGYRSAATNTGNSSAATNTGYSSAATNTGYRSAATNTGYRSAATNTGNSSAATNTGYRSAATNTGNSSAATNTGDISAATNTGNSSAATNTGDRSAATNTGDSSAATNTGNSSAATNTGNSSAATNTGYSSAATNTGDRSAATVEGKHSVAIAAGYAGKAKAAEGSAIVLCYRNENYELVHIRAAIAGRGGIKPNVFYMLNAAGEFAEVE